MGGRFDDGKEAGALRTIGEVSVALGIKTHVLRYWEQQFPMLDPLKRSGGRRYYRPEDVALVEEIDRLVNREGYTLRGARAALGGAGSNRQPEPTSHESTSSNEASSLSGREVSDDVLERLKAIRGSLASALDA